MNWNDIIQTATNKDSNLWEEGRNLLTWADKNASQEEKENFVAWVDNDWSNVTDVMPRHETEDFFESAPSWGDLY